MVWLLIVLIDLFVFVLFDLQLVCVGVCVVVFGDCIVCYIVKDGKLFVGGLLFVMLFGMIYVINIMLDVEMGIGCWLCDVFVWVLCIGIGCNGQLFYLVFLYIYFMWMLNDDIVVVYVYLMMCELVYLMVFVNDLVFLLNFWLLVVFWNVLFLCEGVYQLDLVQFV